MDKNMFFKLVCLILVTFVVSHSGAASYEDKLDYLSQNDFSVKAENDTNNSTDDCQSDDDCNYFGQCEEIGGKHICSCYKGLSGKNCAIIDECIEDETKCGTETDAKCSFDTQKKKAICRCKTKGKRFDVPSKKCVDQMPCTHYKNCTNGGQCLGKEGSDKYCRCNYGTSGDFCDRVEECENNLTLCGEGKNVKCRYNSYLLRAYCQCEDANQRYDLAQRKCIDRVQCEDNSECTPYGVCFDKCQGWEPCLDYETKEKKKSCHCLEGTSGHKCEVIDDCFNKIVDCGTGDNVICKYFYISGMADSAHAYCECKNSKDKFDKSDKTCKNCDCGPKGKCDLVDGKKSCTCEKGTFNQGDRCEDCKCGEGSHGCNVEEGIKECVCKPGYKQRYDTCEKCDCGSDSTDCTFKDGRKICSCKPGFVQGNYGVCTIMCDDKHRCENGGRCLGEICMCLVGTGGPFCETVYACEDNLCGTDGTLCRYNTRNQRAYCHCQNENTTFDSYDKTCKECRCEISNTRGKLGDCEFHFGKKVCSCYEYYAFNPKDDVCSGCFCGEKDKAEGCTFDKKGKKVCQCQTGYKENWGTCLECKCGEHEVCNFKGDEQVINRECVCEAGYFKRNNKCEKCECGPNGLCEYNSKTKTDCKCEPGFAEDSGKCKFCSCGQNSKCNFKKGIKRCECPKGFKDYDGYCTEISPPNYTPWKIGYGVVAAVFAIIVLVLLYVIFRLRK